MTTVVYSNGVLAADKRSSAAAPAEGVERKAQRCPHCGEAHKRVASGEPVNKVETPKKFTIDGKPILAFAGTGSATQLRALGRYVRTFSNYELLTNAWRFHRSMSPPVHPHDNRGVGPVVLCLHAEGVYELTFGRILIVKASYDLSETRIVGSGTRSAELFLKLAGKHADQAVNAVVAASLVDESTGDGINYFSLKNATTQINGEELSEEEYQRRRQSMLQGGITKTRKKY